MVLNVSSVYFNPLTICIGIVCMCLCLIMIKCSMMNYGVTVYLWEDTFSLERHKKIKNMNYVSYNCRGLNLLKNQYIKSLLENCHVFVIQEDWLMSNAISLLQTDFINHVVFAKSGITENKPLHGRPYGGFICKSFPCISNMVETNCDRICAALSEFTSFTILFISIYMPCDTYSNTYEFNSVLSDIPSRRNIIRCI